MMHGKVTQAAKLMDQEHSLGVHDLTNEVKQVVLDKHPEPTPLHPEVAAKHQNEPSNVEPVIFESIDKFSIYKAAKNTFGSAGPGHVDSDQ
jgi:hypothetical protein